MRSGIVTWVKIILLIIISMAAGCVQVAPEEPQAFSQYSRNFRRIDFNSSHEYFEVDQFGVDAGSIAALFLIPGTDQLLVVTVDDGFLRRVDLEGGSILMEESLGIATSAGVSFDQAGQLISAARQVEIKDEGYGEKMYIVDIGIWDTNNGELVTCVDLVCYEGSRWDSYLLGISLDPCVKRYVYYEDLSFVISDIDGGYSSISLVDSIGARKEKTIGRIEFEENGERMAISYQEGCIEVRDGPPFLRLGSCDSETREPIVDLDFSANGDQLAQIRMDEITLWELGRLRGRLSLSIRLTDATHLEFANTDDYLLVSSSDTITILESKEGRLVHEFQTLDITTFTISPDDRLLIWGDKYGVIHIIGSPLNNDG